MYKHLFYDMQIGLLGKANVG